ncbi:pseudouridine synthase, partial [Reticulomyxa filosa]
MGKLSGVKYDVRNDDEEEDDNETENQTSETNKSTKISAARVLSISQNNSTDGTTKKHSLCFKYAKLKYEVLDTFEYSGQNYSILKIQTFSGRKHQIRAQLSYEKFPIVGDTTYRCSLPFLANKDCEKFTESLNIKSKPSKNRNSNPMFVGECEKLI